MNRQYFPLPVSIYRGGTSKGVFLMENDLPKDPAQRDRIILALFGSPDPRQIDGLGGADITTSKVAIIGPSSHPEADVDYTFGQVSWTEAKVAYDGNCGNISSAVGPFAIDKGLIRAVEPVTTVRIHLTNTGHILKARVPVVDGRSAVEGDCVIGGVPGTGAAIEMDWSGAVGSCLGRLLPTGRVRDVVEAGGRQVEVSVADAGNILVYVRAADVGIRGTEDPLALSADQNLMSLLEEIRGKICVELGLAATWPGAVSESPYQPFVCVISAPSAYDTYTGKRIEAAEVDVVARLTTFQTIVKAFPGSGTATCGAAAKVKGGLLWEVLSPEARQRETLRIGHPTGIITVDSLADDDGDSPEPVIKKISFVRTARPLLDGQAYIRASVINQ